MPWIVKSTANSSGIDKTMTRIGHRIATTYDFPAFLKTQREHSASGERSIQISPKDAEKKSIRAIGGCRASTLRLNAHASIKMQTPFWWKSHGSGSGASCTGRLGKEAARLAARL